MHPPDDSWAVATLTLDERIAIVRFRIGLRSVTEAGSHPTLFLIAWPFNLADNDGLPSPEVSEQMVKFEEALMFELEFDLLGIFVSVFTHQGIREWSIYTSNADKVCERMTALFAGRPRYPIELAHRDDPDWEQYRNMEVGFGFTD